MSWYWQERFLTLLLQACKHGWYAVSHVTAKDLQGLHSTTKDNKDLIAHVKKVMNGRTMRTKEISRFILFRGNKNFHLQLVYYTWGESLSQTSIKVHRLAGRQGGRKTDWLTYWLTDCLPACLPAYRPTNRLTDSRNDLLIKIPTDRSIKFQIPSKCILMDTSSTVAPASCPKRSAAFLTSSSTSASELERPNPSFNIASFKCDISPVN